MIFAAPRIIPDGKAIGQRVDQRLGSAGLVKLFFEQKTYGHACAGRLGTILRASEERRARYRPSADKTVDEIGIHRYETGRLDRELPRLSDREQNHRSWGPGREGV
jgi:hypothetical protein